MYLLKKNVEGPVVAIPDIFYFICYSEDYCKCMLNFATKDEFEVFVFPLQILALNHIP